jgi:hypothetical protein
MACPPYAYEYALSMHTKQAFYHHFINDSRVRSRGSGSPTRSNLANAPNATSQPGDRLEGRLYTSLQGGAAPANDPNETHQSGDCLENRLLTSLQGGV